MCRPCLYHALSWSRSHVLTARITESSVSDFVLRSASLSPQISGILDVFGACVNLNPGIDTLVVTRPDVKTLLSLKRFVNIYN